MQIEQLNSPQLSADWNDIVSQLHGFRAYHLSEWMNFIEETQGLKKIVYEISNNGETVGYLPGFAIHKGPVRIFASPFEGWNTPYMGPVICSDEDQGQLLQAIYQRLKTDGFHYGQFANPELDPKIILRNGFKTQESITYIALVGDSPDNVLANYSKSTRKNVRRAIRNDLLVESTTDKAFIGTYYEQLCQVFEKSNMRPTYSKQKVVALWDNLMPTGRLIATQVLHEGKVIATRLDFFAGIRMHSFGSASDQEYLRLYPNELARYYVMCLAADKGIKYYDMSGGGTYKEKFGAQKSENYNSGL